MHDMHWSGLRELSTAEAYDVSAGSPIGYAAGYVIGSIFGLILKADPFDGNYYGVGA